MKIAYTGHRDIWVTAQLRALVMQDMINPAVDEVIVGGARGFDLLVGNMAREAFRSFILVLPYPTEIMVQKWINSEDKSELAAQVKAAKKVIILEKYYSLRALFARNRVMIDRADAVVAYWDGREKGGTYAAVKYARSCNKPVRNIYQQALIAKTTKISTSMYQ